MKKKYMAAIMAGMLLSLSACGGTNGAGAGKASEDVVKEEIAESTSAEAEPNEQPPAGSEQITAGSHYLDVEYNYFMDSCYEEASLMYGHYNTIRLNSEEYPALTAAVEAYNQTHAEEKQAYLDELENWAKEEYKEYGADMFMGPFVAEADMYLRRADAQVLSVVEACYSYEGGVHGNSYYTSVNFDVPTGEEISLDSVILDMHSLPEVLATEIQEKYPDLTFWSEDLSVLLQEYIAPTNPETTYEFTWTLDYEGVTFYFSDYELGSYADGRQEVMLAYSEYPELFNNKYFKNVDDHYVVALLDSWRGSDMDLHGDGVTDYISIQKNYSVDHDFCESYSITVNGNTYTQDVYYYDLWTYFVKAKDSNYLYIQRLAESDFQTVSVYEITENSVEYIGDFSNSLEGFTNSLYFGVSKRVDLLSTYFATADCTIGEEGMPVEINDTYTVNGEVILTSTVPISAELVDKEGSLLGISYEFPAGTKFRFLTTDGATYVDVQANDEQRCRFYTTPDWPPTVNEMNAETSFEMLWYAG